VHHANHWYGHVHVLARYCGLDEPPRVSGHVQHGWNVLHGFGTRHEFEPGWPRFVWSDGPRRRGLAMDGLDSHVIGAPWNYLLRLEPEPDPAAPREGTIWYPFHGWELQNVIGDHRAISHGFRGRDFARTDRSFLDKQLAELRAHRRVASNRLSTAIFYGLSVGCEAAVYGDPMVLEDAHPLFGGVARLERLWPELHGERIDAAAAREIARTELGMDHVAEPEELRELFRWPAGRP
jgi:hypothetical protein